MKLYRGEILLEFINRGTTFAWLCQSVYCGATDSTLEQMSGPVEYEYRIILVISLLWNGLFISMLPLSFRIPATFFVFAGCACDNVVYYNNF